MPMVFAPRPLRDWFFGLSPPRNLPTRPSQLVIVSIMNLIGSMPTLMTFGTIESTCLALGVIVVSVP